MPLFFFFGCMGYSMYTGADPTASIFLGMAYAAGWYMGRWDYKRRRLWRKEVV